MDLLKEDATQSIEPQFLSRALSSGVKLRIGEMNKTEHEGIVQAVGRYEINIEENGKTVTILKQEISYLTAFQPLLQSAPTSSTRENAPQNAAEDPTRSRPNIQQEFLDKAIKENQVLTLFLMNGQRIKANIEAYDNFTVLLKEGGKQHLFYKHSITTINR